MESEVVSSSKHPTESSPILTQLPVGDVYSHKQPVRVTQVKQKRKDKLGEKGKTRMVCWLPSTVRFTESKQQRELKVKRLFSPGQGRAGRDANVTFANLSLVHYSDWFARGGRLF